MLSNFQLGDQALLQSFLVGQPELRTMMQSPQMQQLRQRVIASYHLGPLDRAETQAYIEHRLRHVGWKDDPRVRAGALRPDPRADRRHSAADQHAVQPAAARGLPRREARRSNAPTCRRSRARFSEEMGARRRVVAGRGDGRRPLAPAADGLARSRIEPAAVASRTSTTSRSASTVSRRRSPPPSTCCTRCSIPRRRRSPGRPKGADETTRREHRGRSPASSARGRTT